MSHSRARLVSRRSLLRAGGATLGLGALGGLLQACASAPPTPQVVEKVVTKEVVREVVVTATASSAAKPAAAPPAAAKVTTITLATDFNIGARKAMVDRFKSEFEAKNPNVKVTHWHMGTGGATGVGGYRDILVAQLATDTAADVMQGWGTIVVERPDSLASMADVLKDRSFNKDDYLWDVDPAAHYDKEGRLKSLPLNRTSSGWLYNKTMFDKAGLKEPTDQWTWNNVLEAARALTRTQEKEWGTFAEPVPWNSGYFELIWAEVGKLRDGKRTAFTDGTAPDAFEFLIDMIYKHKVSPDPGGAASLLSTDVSRHFASGKIGMMGSYIHAPYGLSEQIKDRFEWGVMPTPKSVNTGFRGHNASMEPAAISEASRKRGTFDAAVDYYVSWLSDDMQQWIATRKDRPILPIKKKFLNIPEHLAGPPANREVMIKQLLSEARNQVSFQYFKGWGEWEGAIRREMTKAYNGEVPPKTALANASKAGDAVLARAEL